MEIISISGHLGRNLSLKNDKVPRSAVAAPRNRVFLKIATQSRFPLKTADYE
jgi:hypothetical protein